MTECLEVTHKINELASNLGGWGEGGGAEGEKQYSPPIHATETGPCLAVIPV